MVLHSSQQGHCSSFASHLVRDEGCVQLQHFWRLWTHLFFICISLTEVRCCATSHWLICQLCVSRSEASLQLLCPVFNCFNLKLSFQSIWGNHSSRDTSFENVLQLVFPFSCLSFIFTLFLISGVPRSGRSGCWFLTQLVAAAAHWTLPFLEQLSLLFSCVPTVLLARCSLPAAGPLALCP